MKRLDFSVLALISPLQKPVEIMPELPSKDEAYNIALKLANSIRESKFILPQVELLGKQMTKGPGHIRMLRFDRYEVADVALFKVIKEMDADDRQRIQGYLWAAPKFMTSPETKMPVELDPPFAAAEESFKRLFRILDQIGALQEVW